MALIRCPDCDRSISDAAPACPGCGRPHADPRPPVVIEATRKKYKGVLAVGMIIAVLGCGIGVVCAIAKQPLWPAAAMMGIGSVLYVYAMIAAWWNHG